MKSITPTISAAIALISASTHLSAEWVVVDRFEDPNLPGWFLVIPNFDNPDRVDPEDPPRITVIPDPFGGEGNVLEVLPGRLINQTVNMFASLLIPEEARIFDPFPDEGRATLYLRVAVPMVGNRPAQLDSGWGLVGFFIDEMGNPRFEEDGSPLRPITWGNFSTMARFEPDGIMDIRDEAASPQFVALTENAFSTDVWYELWYVINHPENTYRKYIRGGPEYPGPDPVLLYPFSEDAADAEYRTKTFEDLGFFMIGTTTGAVATGARGIDPYYIAQIHIDPTGINLTTPPGAAPGEPTGPFGRLVANEWAFIANVGLNYGFQNGPGWSYHVDLGPLHSGLFPWLYHHPYGWLYYHGGDYASSGMFLHSATLGWLYTAAGSNGHIYVYNTETWVPAKP